MGKRENAQAANQQWFAERYDRAKENWSNYSKWTTLLQRDIDSYSDKHVTERGAIVARLESQGYAKDSAVYREAMSTMENRQQGDIAEATADLQGIKTGATREILIGDGSQYDATPYSEYLTEYASTQITTTDQEYRDMYDNLQLDEEARTREGDTAYFKTSMMQGTERGQMSMEDFYTGEYGVWQDSPASIRQEKELESSKRARAESGGQRAYGKAISPQGMAGGRAMGSEFDLDPTVGDDRMEDLEDLSLRGF